jgi:hypothetical protein
LAKRLVATTVVALALCACSSRQPQAESASAESSSPKEASPLDAPLPSFSQDIQSTVKSLSLKRGEKTLVPITIHNTEPTILATIGKDPITISYKWFDHGKMLPIEGERTGLPVLKPGESVDVKANVVAPDTPGDMVLKITLVQEGVTWFMTAGAKSLELPVTVH